MLLTKQQLRAHVMTSTDEERYALSHVKVEPDGRVSATNGHLAVLVTPKGQARIEEAEFPPIPGLDGDNPTAPLYLTAETAQAAEAIAPGRDPTAAETVATPAPEPPKKARGKVVKKKAKKPAGRRR